MCKSTAKGFCMALLMVLELLTSSANAAASDAFFNVKDYGATGKKADDGQVAIQKAVDACAAAGGGIVYLPPGEYTSGTIHLRSHVRFHLEAGATLFASENPGDYDKRSLLYGEDIQNIAIEGRGTVDGQAKYDWRPDDIEDFYIRDNKLLILSLGKSIMRSFPKDFPKRTFYPRLVLLVRCKDVRLTGVSFVHSPSWTINPYACERLVIDGIYVSSSLKEAVWADGIDPDGCRDVRISNSTIETGDDALVFYSANVWGPALPCENITVTNCRLSSASSALKFCDVNMVAIRKVTIDNVVITNSNRGIAFMVFDGGTVSDVVISSVTIDTHRFDWFWWGDGDPIHFNIKRRSEIMGRPPKPDEPRAGSIRNVMIRNVIARGKGACLINGHPESWLEGIRLENLRLFLSADPNAPYDKTIQAMKFRWARDLKIKDLDVVWEKPESEKWGSALLFQDVNDLELEGVAARPARLESETPAIALDQVKNCVVRNSRPQSDTRVFLGIRGETTGGILLRDNDFRQARVPYRVESNVNKDGIKVVNNITSAH